MIGRRYRNNRKRASARPVYTVITLVIILALCFGGNELYLRQKSKLDPPKGVTFGIWYPKYQKDDYTLQENTLRYDALTATITFKLNSKKNNNILTFTEQAVPESFADAPEEFDKQVASLQQVTKFESFIGPVVITRSFEGGQSSAILRGQGTVVYMYSSQKINVDDWRAITNNLELIK